MLLIDRYITKTVLSAILLIVCMLTGLQIFILFVNELGDIGKGDYGVFQALVFVLMTMPYQVYLFLPMASLLGCLIGLGIMGSANELVVMRASCMSIEKVISVVLRVAVFLILIVTFLGEMLFPKLILRATENKYQAVNAGQSLRTDRGVWLRSQNDFINIGRVINNKSIADVTQFHFDSKHHLVFIRQIDRAAYAKSVWLATGIVETRIYPDSTKVFRKNNIDWSVEIVPSILNFSSAEPDEMTFPELWLFIKNHKDKYLRVENYQLALWQRLVQPFTTVVMMILAVPFIFGPLRSSTMGAKLLLGATIGFGFYIMNRFFGSLSQIYQFSTIFAAVGPTVLFALLGFYLMRKVR